MIIFEDESKWTITKKEYNTLFFECDLIKEEKQINTYYDQDWKLYDLGATCRIRLLEEIDAELTVKIPEGWDDDNTRKMREFNFPFWPVFESINNYNGNLVPGSLPTNFFKHYYKSEVADILTSYGITEVAWLGSMYNTRKTLKLSSEFKFELDKAELPENNVLYEVEIEESDKDRRKQIIQNVLELVPDAKPSKISKYQRFVEIVRNKK